MRTAHAVLFALAFILATPGVGIGYAAAATTETCTAQGIQYACLTETVVTENKRYGYGYDEEGNVIYGARNLTTHPLVEPFPTTINSKTTEQGITLSPSYEVAVTVSTNGDQNTVASDYDAIVLCGLDYDNDATPLIPALEYRVRFNHSDIMSGVTTFYYRSPLKWLPDHYEGHRLVIRDATTLDIIAGRAYTETAYCASVQDPEIGLVNDRLYYKVNGLLRPGVDYIVTEYIDPKPGYTTKHELDYYAAPHADLNEDGHNTTTIFPGTTVARTFYLEPAYMWRMVHGTGPGMGVVSLLQAQPERPWVILESEFTPPILQRSNADKIVVSIPLRLTQSVAEWSLTVDICGTFGSPFCVTIGNIGGSAAPLTGTIKEEFKLDTSTELGKTTDSQHYYDITLKLKLASTTGCGYAECTLATYPVYRDDDYWGSHRTHLVEYWDTQTNPTDVESHHSDLAWWIDVWEECFAYGTTGGCDTNLENARSLSTTGSHWLLTAGAILAGIAISTAILITFGLTIPLWVPAAAVFGTLIAAGTANLIVAADGLTTRFTDNAIRDAAGLIFTTATCAASLLAPGKLLKLAAGAACIMSLGDLIEGNGWDLLPDIIEEVHQVIKAAVEILAVLLVYVLELVTWLLAAVVPMLKLAGHVFVGLSLVWVFREIAIWIVAITAQLVVNFGNSKQRGFLRKANRTARALPIPIYDGLHMRISAGASKRGTYYKEALP